MFLQNQWYVAAWDHEIGYDPVSRTICGIPVMLYRRMDGTIAAMRDACPHRLLPLSMGMREGDNIRCRYHGLLLDSHGQAVEMPMRGDDVNQSVHCPTLTAVERFRLVWVWIGDANQADESALPDYWMCEEPGWVFDGGLYHVKCDYRLMIDNLMDLTHETYVHPESIGQSELLEAPIETRTEADRVIVRRWMANVEPPPAWRGPTGAGGRVDRWQICNFIPPASVLIDVGTVPAGSGPTLDDHPVRSFVVDFMTPETETTCWYFWGAARKAGDGDHRTGTDRTKTVQGRVFMQDVEVLEAQQKSILANPDMKLQAYNIDAGGVRSRLLLQRLIKAQRDGAKAEKTREAAKAH